jgi:hypothetical protein
MSNVRHVCDRCGRLIPPGLRSLLHCVEGPLREHHPATDLCEDCGGDLAAWLSGETSPRVAAPLARPRR